MTSTSHDEACDEAKHQDALIMDQRVAIENEIRASQPLISTILPLSSLAEEYADNVQFQMGIHTLVNEKNYRSIQRIRGDGNCFYRGFLFGYCQYCVGKPEATAQFLETIRRSKGELLALGYEDLAMEAFYDVFIDFLTALPSKTSADVETFFAQEETGESNYLVWYCRLLTAGLLKREAERFQPFVDGLMPGKTVAQFCTEEVEPMGKECEQVQIIALTEALQIAVRIEYLDGHASASSSYVYPENLVPQLTLLYRPGHYDVLWS